MPATRPLPDGEQKAPARKRRGFPVLPTVMVLIAVPTLVGFGLWQLQRLHWKDALLKELAQNATAPVLEIGSAGIPPNAQFRRARLFLSCDAAPAALRAGRNLAGETGYSHIASCRTAAQPVLLDAGWTARPDRQLMSEIPRIAEGTLVHAADGGWLLVDAASLPPLQPSAPPSPDTISNNHLSYAIQWFSFATILAVIYGLWLRRWLAQQGPRA